MLVIVVILSIATVALAIMLMRFFVQSKKTQTKYKAIIDVDKEVSERINKITEFEEKISELEGEFQKRSEVLSNDYSRRKKVFDDLVNETAILEENLEDISYGLYKPHYGYSTSDQYKIKMEEIRVKQKNLIKSETATFCGTVWTVGNSKAEGKRMTKHYSKLMLRAFNGEGDSAIAKVTWNNASVMEARIEKAYEAINKLGSTHQIVITDMYKNLKLDELRLEFELQEKLQQEREEQRKIKEQMREEERALREMEKAEKEAMEDEERYQKALEKAKEEISRTEGDKMEKLKIKIAEMEALLAEAKEKKERALSMAQQTKSGHIYIISNIGSFGENIFKIGMTRRLEPLDRVKELGDASVPFEFDVHAMIFSKNAPELEYNIHSQLTERRVNLINNRKEFFNVKIDEIEDVAKKLSLEIQLTKLAEAREYRETTSIKDAKNNKNETMLPPLDEKFPSNI